jgi:hypothetical protein
LSPCTGKRIGRRQDHDGTVTCIAYTPDGRMLISGSIDRTVRLWDVATSRHLRLLSIHEEAITAIAISPDGKLVASSNGGPRRYPFREMANGARLIAQLDSEVFAERESAEQALEKLGEGVVHVLTRALEGKVDLEFQRRAKRLLKKCDEAAILGYKRHHRAVLTLEWIGTPAARALLRNLADGVPSARLTVEARAAVQRLER